MTDILGRAEIWGDGSGAAKALTTSLVAGTAGATARPDFRVRGPSELLIETTMAGTAVDALDLRLDISNTGGTRWDDVSDLLPATIPAVTGFFRVVLPESADYRFLAARIGGDATSTLLMMAQPREPRSVVPGSSLASTVDDSYAARSMCFEDGAGAAEDVSAGSWTDSSGAVSWFSAGRANRGSIDIAATAAGGPTAFQARITKRKDATASTEYLLAATNSVVGGVEDVDAHVIDLPVATGNISCEFPVEPEHEYKVELTRTGGTGLTALAYFNFTR